MRLRKLFPAVTIWLLFFCGDKQGAPGAFSPRQVVKPMLIISENKAIPLQYDEDNKVLFNYGSWRIVMMDSNTVGIVRMDSKRPVSMAGLYRVWRFVNPTSRKMSLRVFGWGHFDLYGNSHLSFSPIGCIKPDSVNEVTFDGSADMHIEGRMAISTLNCRIKSIWPSPEPTWGAFLSIDDSLDGKVPAVIGWHNQIEYWGTENSMISFADSASKAQIKGRLDGFVKRCHSEESYEVGKETADEFLDQLVHNFGLNGYRLDERIDRNEKGCLSEGVVGRELSFDQIMSIHECTYFHYGFKENFLTVTALDPYLRWQKALKKGKALRRYDNQSVEWRW